MSLRQAAQQALDWLEDDAATTVDEAYTKERQIADALRAALAEHDRLAGIEAIEKTAGIHVSQQAEPEQELGQAFKRAIERINELEALNAELVEALRQVEGIIKLSPHALSITRTALMKAKLEYENEDR